MFTQAAFLPWLRLLLLLLACSSQKRSQRGKGFLFATYKTPPGKRVF
ncbi:hypothetical protein [[Phormidium ambiguum] IAM M-71]|nr:hypothetical protein [Phormidium ambiguum]